MTHTSDRMTLWVIGNSRRRRARNAVLLHRQSPTASSSPDNDVDPRVHESVSQSGTIGRTSGCHVPVPLVSSSSVVIRSPIMTNPCLHCMSGPDCSLHFFFTHVWRTTRCSRSSVPICLWADCFSALLCNSEPVSHRTIVICSVSKHLVMSEFL